MEKKPMNVYEFAGCNDMHVRPDGTKMGHEEIYSKVVNTIGLQNLIPHIPVPLERIQRALYDDYYLLSVAGIKHWRPDAVAELMVSVGITSISKSHITCTLKQAARMWAEEAKKEGQN